MTATLNCWLICGSVLKNGQLHVTVCCSFMSPGMKYQITLCSKHREVYYFYWNIFYLLPLTSNSTAASQNLITHVKESPTQSQLRNTGGSHDESIFKPQHLLYYTINSTCVLPWYIAQWFPLYVCHVRCSWWNCRETWQGSVYRRWHGVRNMWYTAAQVSFLLLLLSSFSEKPSKHSHFLFGGIIPR